MFVSFFSGLSVFVLTLGVGLSVLFHLANDEMLAAPDGKAVGVILILLGVALLLGTIAASGFR